MEKEMLEVKVYTSDKGCIIIEQPVPLNHDPEVIILYPDQINIVISWLKLAKKEVTENK